MSEVNLSNWIVILIIILLNSFFVIAEIAILTSKRMRLEQKAEAGSASAAAALKLANEPDYFLSTVQAGVTLMNILIGLLGGATITDDLENFFAAIPFLAPYKEALSNVLIVMFITYLTVLGEIIPKRIAMIYPEKMAQFTSFGMIFFFKLVFPFVWSLSKASQLVLALFKLKPQDQVITTEEFKYFISKAESYGTVEKAESKVIQKVIHLGDMQVASIMTPRSDCVCLNLKDDDEVNLAKLKSNNYSCYPVIDGEIDNVVGIVMVEDMFISAIDNGTANFRDHIKPPVYVPEFATLLKLIRLLKKNQSTAAIVLDEYGDVEGLVTLSDVLKTFLGDLGDIMEQRIPDVVKRDDGSYIISGSTPIEDVMDLMGVASLPGDTEEDFRTLASFILAYLRKIPKAGDFFEVGEWKFQIAIMDKFRIDKVVLRQKPSKK
jgi:putative hemolysin